MNHKQIGIAIAIALCGLYGSYRHFGVSVEEHHAGLRSPASSSSTSAPGVPASEQLAGQPLVRQGPGKVPTEPGNRPDTDASGVPIPAEIAAIPGAIVNEYTSGDPGSLKILQVPGKKLIPDDSQLVVNQYKSVSEAPEELLRAYQIGRR